MSDETFATNVPSNVPCVPGTFTQLDYSNGFGLVIVPTTIVSVPMTGIYLVTYQSTFNINPGATVGTNINAGLLINGSPIVSFPTSGIVGFTPQTAFLNGSAQINLAAGNTIAVGLCQNTGQTISATVGMEIVFLG